ncbi:class I SAM-dependent methyltransferase [Burkholderia cepacia]|uniref:class I SAM-dependent methyltransferase n=1 Tax=Burkholderia cepacia TaxID=292 RepID=UPI0009BBF36B|nr:methyltransferase domain-containing protein [Burkholderia cepacia]
MADQVELDLIPMSDFKPLNWDDARAHETTKKIQYACGLNPFEGWLNVDFFDDAVMWNFNHIGGVPRNVAENVYKVNLLERHPFPDNAFEYAFCEDFVEHLEQKDAITFLSEVFRTLKPGGVVRIATPGFEQVMRNHFLNATFDKIADGHRDAYTQWGHLHFFTHDSLKAMARWLGFSKYRIKKIHKSWHRPLRNLETRVDQAQYMNIYAELTK